jgi:hypothetical protein
LEQLKARRLGADADYRWPAQQLRQLGDIGGDAPGLVEVRRRATV